MFWKRGIDILGATAGLIILSPVIFGVVALVAVRMGRPIFFRQDRPGRGGQPFKFTKFRTMTDERDSKGNLLPDEQRITRLGSFLRKSTLDELPSLWNVLKGDMSLVGPRPLLMEYLPLYSLEQARRHEVKPGLTGWAIINGRNALSWEEKFQMDVWYVDNQSLWLDIKILFRTVGLILSRKGVAQEGRATAEPFRG